MQSQTKLKVFLVDDDPLYLKFLEIEFLHHADFIIETYPTGELCLENLNHKPDVIILDYHLDGVQKGAMNGIETLDKIKEIYPDIPVLMLSSQDKIEVAINCMHHKALDYIVKSETSFLRLKKSINNFFQNQKVQTQLSWYMDRM